MSFLIVTPGKDSKKWAELLKKEDSNLEVYVYPEEHKQEDIEYILSWHHPRGLFKNYPNLKVVASLGAGVEHITSDPALPENIKITKVVNDRLTADMSTFVLSVVLDKIRNLNQYKLQETEGVWKHIPYQTVEETKIGIMGLGVLGAAVAKMLSTFGFKVSGWSKTEKDMDGVTSYHGEDQKEDFLENTSILICLLPLTEKTTGILNKELFEMLPKGAYLINVARGEHLVEHDLLEMVNNGHLSGAALDVFKEEPLSEDHPFWAHPKINVTPHTASKTDPKAVVPQLLDNYHRMQSGKDLKNVVEREKGY